MSGRKWALISTGATFEALVRALLYFDDATTILLGRPGRDAGQDARAADGALVYQAKYHLDASAAKAIADAKKEAEKIRDYRAEGAPQYDLWKGVTRWRLVTNATFNTSDSARWDTEVVPLFRALGLDADYWDQTKLDGMLVEHPEVDRSFFENETRVFVTLPEAREIALSQEPFLRDRLGEFFGREPEVTAALGFVNSSDRTERFLVLQGPGGIGKTRLLLEIGSEVAEKVGWQVLWVNVALMAGSAAWFDGIVPARPTLVLVDEPPDEKVLQQLAEEMRVGRAAKWKAAVAVRSPNDPVVRFLFSPRMKAQVRNLQVGRLPGGSAAAMCESLLASGALAGRPSEERTHVSAELALRFESHPVWLTLAVHLFESTGNLDKVPATAADLADAYVREVVGKQDAYPPERVLNALRRVALLGTVNREDDTLVQVIADGAGLAGLTETRALLARLVARRGLAERGANKRLVELKPDVVRDDVLLRWLSANVGFGDEPVVASDDAVALVAKVSDEVVAGELGREGRATLVAMGRTELLLRLSGHAVSLLSQVLRRIQAGVPTMSAGRRLALADTLLWIASFAPTTTAEIVRMLRSSTVADEMVDRIFRRQTVRHDDIVLSLAWPLFHAAMGADDVDERSSVFHELCALVEAEGELAPRLPRGLPNDGKRAAQLLTRTMEGGPDFLEDFDEIALREADLLVQKFVTDPPTPGKVALLRSLVKTAVSADRHRSWTGKDAVTFQTYGVGPETPGWGPRQALLGRVKDALLNAGTPGASRIALWKLFAEAHATLNRLCDHDKPVPPALLAPLLEDLTWARGALEARTSDVAELSAARELWEWHEKFEKNAELKTASSALEALYQRNDLAEEFETLLAFDVRPERREAEVAAALVARPGNAIALFLDRASRFLGGERDLYRLRGVAREIGTLAPEYESVRAFVRSTLRSETLSPRTHLAAAMAASWVDRLRTGAAPDAAHGQVVDLLQQCGSDEQRANLVLAIYGGGPGPRTASARSPAEHALLRSMADTFVGRAERVGYLGALAATLRYEWEELKALVEELLEATPVAEIGASVRAVIESTYWIVREQDPSSLPPDLARWLLDQVLRVLSLDDIDSHSEWRLNEIVRRMGPLPVSWLARALVTRAQLERAAADGVTVEAVTHRLKLSKWVVPIAAAAAEDVAASVGAILNLVADSGSVSYFVPEILRDIDPEGTMVATEVAARASRARSADEVWTAARIGAAYATGSAPWRIIAKAVLTAPAIDTLESRESIMLAVARQRVRSWSGKPGQVPVPFVTSVKLARDALDAESDPDLRAFWEWNLAGAEGDLHREEERAKEERGE